MWVWFVLVDNFEIWSNNLLTLRITKKQKIHIKNLISTFKHIKCLIITRICSLDLSVNHNKTHFGSTHFSMMKLSCSWFQNHQYILWKSILIYIIKCHEGHFFMIIFFTNLFLENFIWKEKHYNNYFNFVIQSAICPALIAKISSIANFKVKYGASKQIQIFYKYHSKWYRLICLPVDPSVTSRLQLDLWIKTDRKSVSTCTYEELKNNKKYIRKDYLTVNIRRWCGGPPVVWYCMKKCNKWKFC